MGESIQKKLGRVRPPRVQITYDVETGGAIEKKELPFIVGILSNLSGMSKEPLPPIKERKFVEIDRDNFDDVMGANKPECFVKVKNVLSDEAADMNVGLSFSKFDDFEPINIIKQVDPINALFVSRCHLRDLLGKLDGNDPLDAVFEEILSSADLQTELKGAFDGAEDAEAWKAVEPTETMQKLMTDGGMVLDETQKEYSLQLIGEFVTSILINLPEDNQKSMADLLSDKITEIDTRLPSPKRRMLYQPHNFYWRKIILI